MLRRDAFPVASAAGEVSRVLVSPVVHCINECTDHQCHPCQEEPDHEYDDPRKASVRFVVVSEIADIKGKSE